MTATTTTTTTEHRCNWCGAPIWKDARGAWLDSTDGDGCDAPDDVHAPEPTDRDFWQDGPHETQYLDTTITPKDSPVSMTVRAVLGVYSLTSSGEPVSWSITIYRTYHAAGTNVPELGPWLELTEHCPLRSEDVAMTFAEKHVEGLGEVWIPESDAEFAAKVEQVTAVQQVTAARDDRQALDDIAALLGTPDTWDGAADFLDSIAEILARTNRPSVGLSGEAWLRAFRESTGRPYVGGYDRSTEPEPEPEACQMCEMDSYATGKRVKCDACREDAEYAGA